MNTEEKDAEIKRLNDELVHLRHIHRQYIDGITIERQGRDKREAKLTAELEQARRTTQNLSESLQEKMEHNRKLMRERDNLRADLAKAREDRDNLESAFTDCCDELGCEYSNDAALTAIAKLHEENESARSAIEQTVEWNESTNAEEEDVRLLLDFLAKYPRTQTEQEGGEK